MIILLATKLQNGSQSAKVSSSWNLESCVDSLRTLLINGSAVCSSHVRRNGNKVVDILANLGVGACNTVRDKDYNMIPSLKARAQCKDLIKKGSTCIQMEGRNNYNASMKSLQHMAPPSCDL